ncbi:MAG: YdcF family protein [Acidobacteria bacterium]|nr:YdcF family protein [Acidobacteriota bacterium]MBV9476332.1 YdcF family protein [Acidobacteriota bacterium]
MRASIVRGLALFLGLFAIANVAGDLRFAGANGNLWWIDLRPLPIGAQRVVLLCAAAALLVYACRRAGHVRRAASVLLGALAVAAMVDSIRFYVAVANGAIEPLVPLPLSLAVALLLGFFIFVRDDEEPARPLVAGIAVVVAVVVFPLAQIAFFGTTDYRRRADVAVVFGARAFANGTPSHALADRVRTACELQRAGLVRQLVFSGGPGEGAFSEPRVMRRYAESLGVPREAIVEDAAGVNTEASVRNTRAMLGERPARVLVVSHFYHLPRIKMTYQRYGVEVFTVPSHDSVPWSMPFNLVREDAAFWAYYLRRLT